MESGIEMCCTRLPSGEIMVIPPFCSVATHIYCTVKRHGIEFLIAENH